MITPSLFTVSQPSSAAVPVVLSVPHSGTAFPEEERNTWIPAIVEQPTDTDWFVHELYDFAPSLGITVIKAEYSRYVVDLNRNREGARLYSDGRHEISVVPTTTFLGEPLYDNETPDNTNIKRRLETYYDPYYAHIRKLIADLRSRSENVLFFDAHSIRRNVATISTKPFPDLTLGDVDETSANTRLIQVALDELSNGGEYKLTHNDPFKGGNLTRHFGCPSEGIHALQLEMAQPVYMDEDKTTYSRDGATRIREILRRTLERLIQTLQELE